mgnify:CR=1 FL=1
MTHLKGLLLPAAAASALFFPAQVQAAPPPAEFPRFVVPGCEKPMESLRSLYWLHYAPAGPLIPLWDEWMPMSTLWPAVDGAKGAEAMRGKWRAALSRRRINAEGYIHTEQHDGLAHAEGWPFPLWTQAGGVGWHFRGTGIKGYDAPPATPAGWKVTGGRGGEIGDKGWVVELTEPRAALQTPAFAVPARRSPWLRFNWWAEGLEGGNCYVEWTTTDQPEWTRENRAYFSAPATSGPLNTSRPESRTMIPVFRVPGWKGVITGVRIGLDNAGPAQLVIKSFHTACDTRHSVNNLNFVRGCHDYFMWTGDVGFLRDQVGRIRTAMRFILSEFDTRRRKCVYTTWIGHEGRSGIRYDKDGRKTLSVGDGIGSNYWDLLPFGGEDALATIYYYDALLDLAELEEEIIRHPQWGVARGADAFEPADLRAHAQEVKDYGTKRFWNEKTGRFGTRDLDGVLYDYGFVFLNNEAIYYDFATPAQARSIRSWISGTRRVEGDTSTGADIYHWRFGPRSTTRRNVDYYFWGWSNPESVPWGYQVQDGGGVLGFSYHDLMARLQVEGPDSAWQRLGEITAWFDETQAAGGYREYYKDPARGTLQGGNVPGGLGLDREFFESILVPQVMIYGFLGLRPTASGCSMTPRLPAAWPELTITRVHLKQWILRITAKPGEVKIEGTGPADDPLVVELPKGWKLAESSAKFVTPAP